MAITDLAASDNVPESVTVVWVSTPTNPVEGNGIGAIQAFGDLNFAIFCRERNRRAPSPFTMWP
jgi:hypothetical protein